MGFSRCNASRSYIMYVKHLCNTKKKGCYTHLKIICIKQIFLNNSSKKVFFIIWWQRFFFHLLIFVKSAYLRFIGNDERLVEVAGLGMLRRGAGKPLLWGETALAPAKPCRNPPIAGDAARKLGLCIWLPGRVSGRMFKSSALPADWCSRLESLECRPGWGYGKRDILGKLRRKWLESVSYKNKNTLKNVFIV